MDESSLILKYDDIDIDSRYLKVKTHLVNYREPKAKLVLPRSLASWGLWASWLRIRPRSAGRWYGSLVCASLSLYDIMPCKDITRNGTLKLLWSNWQNTSSHLATLLHRYCWADLVIRWGWLMAHDGWCSQAQCTASQEPGWGSVSVRHDSDVERRCGDQHRFESATLSTLRNYYIVW